MFAAFQAGFSSRWRCAGLALLWVGAALLVGNGVLLIAGPHALGTADNFDFERVMQTAELKHVLAPGERPDWETLHTDFRRYYEFTQRRPGEPTRSSAIYSLPATSMARAVSRAYRWVQPTRTVFDIKYLGLTYLLLGLISIGLGLRSQPARDASALLLAALLLFVFFDPEYVLLLSSFYCEPVAFVALLGLCASLCRCRATRGSVIAAAACALILSLTKAQFIGSGLVLLAAMLLSTLFARLTRRQGERPGALGWSCVLACAMLPILMYQPRSNAYRPVNRFDAIFDGVLADTNATETDRVMTKLGLDSSLKWLAGVAFWSGPQREKNTVLGSSPVRTPIATSTLVRLDPAQWMHVSLTSLAKIYVSEPVVTAHLLRVSERNLTMHDPTLLSNYAKGEHPTSGDRFYYHAHGPRMGWLRERFASLPWQLFAALALVLVLFVARGLWQAGPMQRGRWVALNFLLWFAFTQIAVVVLGDGYESFERHLFASRFALDLALAVGCAMAVDRGLRALSEGILSSNRPIMVKSRCSRSGLPVPNHED